MPFFSYRAIDQDGSVVKGTAEGMDIDNAYEAITSSGLHVLNIRKANTYFIAVSRKIFARNIKRTAVIEFANNLSVMLRAGMPLMTALADISDTSDNKYFKKVIDNIKRRVEFGSKLSEAVAEHKDVFPDIFIRIVGIGEETGALDTSLSDIATHLQRMEDLRAAIKRALIYPIFAIVTTTVAMLFWLLYVLPRVMAVFKDMGITLPLPTRILIAMSHFTQSYWYIILLMPVAASIAIQLLKRNRKTKYYVDLAKIKIPIIKEIVYNKLIALLSEQARILTSAGITIGRTFEVVTELLGSEVFRVAIEDSMKNISAGSRIADAMRDHAVFPPMMIRMIHIGETSGTLDEQFNFLAEYYLKKLDDISQKLSKMVEPIVISIIGGMFALIIVGLLMPVYDLITKMGK